MAFDSSTLCARTSAGEAELATPSQGLSLGQRRVLTLLQNPVAVDELAQQHRLEPEKLARDLTRLADLRLVVLQGPSIATTPPATVPVRAPSKGAASMAPIVIGRRARRASTLPLLAGAAALVAAVGVWYGTRASPAPAEAPKPTATAPAPATSPAPAAAELAPVPTPPAANALNAVAAETSSAPPVAAPAMVLRESAPPASARPPARAETVAATPAATKAALSPVVSAPKGTQRPEAAGNATAGASTATGPTVAPPAAPTPAMAASPAAAADAPPPVQLAAAAPSSAAPSSAAPRPAATTALKPISREPPDFPKEAIADGYKSGIVNARIHVDAHGSVTGVDIMGSQPPKVFDRAARRALLRWQFEPNAAGQPADLDVDVKFQRD
jgi:protein TonB